MGRCNACRVSLDDADRVLVCSECEFVFHVGDCSAVSEKAFINKRETSLKAWKCSFCKPAGGKSQVSAANQASDNILVKLAEIDRKLSSLLELPAQVSCMEKSVQVLSDHFDAIQQRLDTHDNDIKDVKSRLEKIEKQGAIQQLSQLESDVEDLQRRSRRLNLEIQGVTEDDGEDLLSKVNGVAQRLQVALLCRQDVVALHRLPGKPGKPRGIIVRFARQELADAWLANKRNLRNSGDKVYIAENLTLRTRKLLYFAKEWAKSAGYRYVWCSNGKVLVRKNSGDPAVVVKCSDELSALAH